MTFLDILYSIFIGPLQLVFEIIYMIANRFIGHPGLSIVVLSLIMNFLVLPLYKRSDDMQEVARDIENKLSEGVTHIKKTFSGDEQMMILQTYYRQNNYKPTDALNGSVSLLLEVPFFMAAYNFLSNLQLIQGVSLGPIADLGVPDALLSIGDVSINVLPILMTLVNIISSAIYLKGFPLKTKVQLYGMAMFFLVFLYTSPAGLVFYWTLNNLFSLAKTLFYKLNLFEGKTQSNKKENLIKNDIKMFIFGGLFITVLVGILIPSALIAASPQEFIDASYFYNPLWYIAKTLCLAAGTFLVWFGVFYWISSPKGKVIFDRLIWILCGIMLVNYMFFGTELGIISSSLQYEKGMNFGLKEKLVNLLVLAVVAFVLYIIVANWKKAVSGVLLTGCIAMVAMAGLNMSTIHTSVVEVEKAIKGAKEETPHFNLSKNGKNVVIIMLDRAMGHLVPYILDEKPELKEQFAGFTYYSNVISYGGMTNFCAPSLYGGYEYTPVELNKRDEESLVSKHNEALKIMPELFYESGYDVTVMDPPYANYQWIPDLSIYDEYPEMNTYITKGKFDGTEQKAMKVQMNLRNFFCFSVMKTMPLAAQGTIYYNGSYNSALSVDGQQMSTTQTVQNYLKATGTSVLYMEAYNVLKNMETMTTITEENTNTFMMMANDATHEPMLLQEPDYVPSEIVDNTPYYQDVENRFTVDGRFMKMETVEQIAHYHANMASLIELGKWMDYLRENDVYDNTRIIIVADHGRGCFQLDELLLGHAGPGFTAEFYFPLMLIKDFDSKDFTISDEFMTNADVPTIAFHSLIDNPINPFTGNPINNACKDTMTHYIINSSDWDVQINNGNVFIPSTWWTVKDNIWDGENWGYIDEVTAMPEN